MAAPCGSVRGGRGLREGRRWEGKGGGRGGRGDGGSEGKGGDKGQGGGQEERIESNRD